MGGRLGYSWYRVDSAFARHPKTLRLKAELNEPLADAYLNRLWSWAQLYAPSGRFLSALAPQLEADMGWTGLSGSLAAALEKTGWLDRVGDEFEVHDWADFQGFHVKKSKKDADKKRKRRERMSARTDSGQNGAVHALSPRTAPPTDVTDGRNVTDATTSAAEELGALWNSITTPPLPRVEMMPPDRLKKARAALKRRPLEQWREVFMKAEASAFCHGESGKDWLANFDWAIRPAGVKPEPALMLIEGTIGGLRKPKTDPVPSSKGMLLL